MQQLFAALLFAENLRLILLCVGFVALQVAQAVAQVGQLQRAHHQAVVFRAGFRACLDERVLHLDGLLLHCALVALRARALMLNVLQLLANILQRLVQLHARLLGLPHPLQVRVQVGGRAFAARLFAGDGNLLLMQGVHRVADLLPLLLRHLLTLRQFLTALVQFRAPGLQLRGQFLQFALTAEQVGHLRLRRTARHRAAGVHHVALQRHQAERVIARAHNRNAVVEVVGNHRAPQQIFHNAAVFRRALHQFARHAEAARQLQRIAFIAIERFAADGAHRQKRRAPQPILAQVVNQLLRRLFRVGDDVLLCRAQRHVNRRFVRLRNGHQLRQYALNALQAALLGIGHRAANRHVVAFHVARHFGQDVMTACRGLHIGGLLFDIRAQIGIRGVRLIRRLPRLCQILFTLLLMLRFRLQLRLDGIKRFPKGSFLLLQCPAGFLNFRQARFHLRLHGVQARLVVAHVGQAVHLVNDSSFLRFQRGVRFLFLRLRLLGGFLRCPEDLLRVGNQAVLLLHVRLNPRMILLDFRQPLLCFLLLADDALAVLAARLAAALQGGELLLRFVHMLGAFHQFGARLRDGFFQLIDAVLRLIAARGLVGQGAFRIRQNRLDGQQFAFQLGQACPRPVGANQEKVQVQILQFGGQLQIHAGVSALLFQRLQALRQLIQNIIDALQIFQRPLQFLVRFFLARLELDDARRFLKHLPAILALAGEDFVNAPLPDDGVSLFADARIAEEVNHVLQAAGGAV